MEVVVQKEPFAACTSVPRSMCPSELGVVHLVGEVEDKVALEVTDDSEGSKQEVEGNNRARGVDGKSVDIVGLGVPSLLRCLSVSILCTTCTIILFILYIVYIKPPITTF